MNALRKTNRAAALLLGLSIVLGACEPGASEPVSGDEPTTKASQTISFPPSTPTSQVLNSLFSVAPTSTSGLPVSIVLAGGCAAEAGQIRMTSGTVACVITASQPGNDDFTAAPDVTYTVGASGGGTQVPGGSPVPAVAVGSWKGGLLSHSNFWDDHTGAYQGAALGLSILFHFEASGSYRQATYILSRTYGCVKQIWSATEGRVTFDEGTFRVRPTSGRYKLVSSCDPASNEERPLRSDELNGAEYYWEPGTDPEGRAVLLIGPNPNSHEVFRPDS